MYNKSKCMSNSNLISIIITTKNEGKSIKKCLESIICQNYKNFEVIVIDNNSTDNTKKIIDNLNLKFKGLRISFYNKGPERSAQRNFGAKIAKGEYFLFLDADMILDQKVIEQCFGKIKNDEVGAVIIPEKSIGEGFWSKVKAFERSFYVGDESIEATRFFKKKVFLEAGGYNEGITGPEDWDLSQKVKEKYKIDRIRNFILHNEGKALFWDFIKKKYYYGKSSPSYLKKHSLSLASRQAVYFLRPAFYKNWRRLIKKPDLAFGMTILLFTEQAAGFFGFLRGQFYCK